MPHQLKPKDFAADAPTVAQMLIGATVLVDGVGGLIVETEAYDESDPASHCHPGQTPRNRAMFGPPGHAYVYFNYGLHWCLNFVCGPEGHGSGVLIRALQPTLGIDQMRERRRMQDERLLCAGPGRLGQALGVSRALYGLPLDEPPFRVLAADPRRPMPLVCGPRIGIKRATELPWRFGCAGSRYLSRRF